MKNYVDMGLPSGTLWATFNLGASLPEENGCFYAWGESETKIKFDWDNYAMCWSFLSKYNINDKYGKVDDLTELELLDDAANANWGNDWQIPSDAQWEELFSSCIWRQTKKKDVIGYNVIGTNGNSLFLPMTGYYKGDKLVGSKKTGGYWSRTLFSIPSDAWSLFFDSDDVELTHCLRYIGLCIRPVRRLF